jgi:hypothetical protein
MAVDLLERLRDAEVPEIPADIDDRIHERLNTSLTVTHLVDFVCNALPHAFLEFSRPLGELARQTTGAHRTPRRSESNP